ncbi:MAG: hypothetical protein FJW88_12835 [Actinobacteria bacterium]|nr:hypothetical protein [Actinomycetota bacterium]
MPLVEHAQLDHRTAGALRCPAPDPDGATRRRDLERVRDEVVEHLLHATESGAGVQVVFERRFDRHVTLCSQRRPRGDSTANRSGKVDCDGCHSGALRASKREQPVDQA